MFSMFCEKANMTCAMFYVCGKVRGVACAADSHRDYSSEEPGRLTCSYS